MHCIQAASNEVLMLVTVKCKKLMNESNTLLLTQLAGKGGLLLDITLIDTGYDVMSNEMGGVLYCYERKRGCTAILYPFPS